jgi:hypothetical protein
MDATVTIQSGLAHGLLFTLFSVTPLPVSDHPDRLLEIGSFSTASPGATAPDGWKPLTFKNIARYTTYEVVQNGDQIVIKAVSEASASGLARDVMIDPREYPIVRWRWKVENVLLRSDVRRKDGDDYPARLYITFQYEADKVRFTKKLKYQAARALFGDIPIAALNYIWDTRTPVGTLVENAYTDFAQMIVVESGPESIGRWVDEERNVYQDYKQAFGGEPPRINGVAIMTDTDNTKERATAYYGDITFAKE